MGHLDATVATLRAVVASPFVDPRSGDGRRGARQPYNSPLRRAASLMVFEAFLFFCLHSSVFVFVSLVALAAAVAELIIL